jgi:hypothetical protein
MTEPSASDSACTCIAGTIQPSAKLST